MKIIVLCGGRGERFPGALPKPLTRVCGLSIGKRMIESLIKHQVTDLFWFVNPKLERYNFKQEVEHWSKGKINNTIIYLPYETRDPCETITLGLKHLTRDNDSYLFVDNDNIYGRSFGLFNDKLETDYAILVSPITEKVEPRYGFVKIENGLIVEGREKIMNWGENAFSYGCYWFRNREILEQTIMSTSNNTGETSLLTIIMKNSHQVLPILTTDTYSIGTPQDCAVAEAKNLIGWKDVRICVDLDNTLVTYPQEYGDYNSAKPIVSMIEWIKDKKARGAIIIVHTARRMKSNHNDQAKLLANDGLDILRAIDNLNLEPNEISLFKPYADLYIDDNAISAYSNTLNQEVGEWSGDNSNQNLVNCLPTTRKVVLKTKMIEFITKSGPVSELEGQAYYYRWLKTQNELSSFFPICIENTSNQITIEYVKGIPMSMKLSYQTFNRNDWRECLAFLNKLHRTEYQDQNINFDDAQKNYIEKVESRLELIPQYTDLWLKIKARNINYRVQRLSVIHGDFFASNIIFSMKGGIKVIDMRGKLGDKLTVIGDPNYDWAKIITSFLGMDSIVYDMPKPQDYTDYIKEIPNWLTNYNLALLLMFGSIIFYETKIQEKIVKRLEELL